MDGDSRHEWIAIYKIFKQNFFIQEHMTKQICYSLNDLWFGLRSDLKIVLHQRRMKMQNLTVLKPYHSFVTGPEDQDAE